MNKLVLLLVWLCTPLIVSAQFDYLKRNKGNLDIGISAGIGTVYAGGEGTRTLSPALGINGTFKAMYCTRKWQLGIGLDGGTTTEAWVERDVFVIYDYRNGTFENRATTEDEDVQLMAPYYSPYALVNYKINIPGRLYFYTGGVFGYTFTRHGFNIKPDASNTYFRKVNGMMFGLNLGLVIKISERVSLDLSEGWRMSMLKEPDPEGYVALEETSRTGFANLVTYFDKESLVSEYNTNTFLTSIGIRITW